MRLIIVRDSGHVFTINMGLCIVYVPFGMCHSGCHRMMEIEAEARRIQDDDRTSSDVWKMVIKLLNKRMKDDKIMVTRNDLRITTRPVNE